MSINLVKLLARQRGLQNSTTTNLLERSVLDSIHRAVACSSIHLSTSSWNQASNAQPTIDLNASKQAETNVSKYTFRCTINDPVIFLLNYNWIFRNKKLKNIKKLAPTWCSARSQVLSIRRGWFESCWPVSREPTWQYVRRG